MLAEWYREEKELKKQLEALTKTQGELTQFAMWWEKVRANLIEIPDVQKILTTDVTEHMTTPLPSGAAFITDSDDNDFLRDIGYTNTTVVLEEKDGRTVQTMATTYPALWIEKDKLRGILKDLGCRVVLWFKPQTVTQKGRTWISKRNYELDRAKIEAGFSNSSELNSSSCIREGTHDKD